MALTVIRNGSHQGQLFVEVTDGISNYAVPTNVEVPVGSEVTIAVNVVTVPKAPESALEGTNVGVAASAVPETAAAPEAAATATKEE